MAPGKRNKKLDVADVKAMLDNAICGGRKNMNVEKPKDMISDNDIRTSIYDKQKNDQNKPSSETSQS